MQEQSASGPQIAAQVLPVNGPATATAAPTVHRGAWRRFLIESLLGFSVLVLGLLAGEHVKMWLHLPVPGNVLGLFLLLLSFRLRLLPPPLIEKAANQLLFVLPSLFIPIYVSAIGQRQLWSRMSWILVPMLLLATAGLWIFVGHLAQKLLRQPVKDE
ncbi:MAG: CidA/LrgA family protein [Verrucomicrobia bacterium]|nr:CidA/LrgA family protein [Verrucomicrobiota bacterium]